MLNLFNNDFFKYMLMQYSYFNVFHSILFFGANSSYPMICQIGIELNKFFLLHETI
jgi:hypothetical protein